MKRVLGWVVNIVLIWLIVIVVALFLLPRFGGWRFDAVLSGSMEPALPLGGVVFIKPVETDEIIAGDIIAYSSGDVLITHRVIDVIDQGGEPAFVTKGDAVENPDLNPVLASAVVGKVIFDIPYLGYLADFVKTRLGFILTIFLPGLAIIGLELRSLWQGVLKKDKAKARPKTKALPSLEMHKETAAIDNHPEVTTYSRSSRSSKIIIGIVIGGAAVILGILIMILLTDIV
jgi:signal peptidase